MTLERKKYPNKPHPQRCRPLSYNYPNKSDALALKVYPAPSHHPTTPADVSNYTSVGIYLQMFCSVAFETQYIKPYNNCFGRYGYQEALLWNDVVLASVQGFQDLVPTQQAINVESTLNADLAFCAQWALLVRRCFGVWCHLLYT